MLKKKKLTSNIQDNHTLGEYQRYFSHLFAKGKLRRYSLNEERKLDPKAQYWKITDEKGETYYYELPKYIKPGSNKSAYSMKRVMHRRPARAALAIFAGTAIISFSSSMIAKQFIKMPSAPIVPFDYHGMQVLLRDFKQWHHDYPTEDVTKHYSTAQLATIGIADALFDKENPLPSNDEDDIYPRRSLLTVGYGNTVTTVGFIKVYVDVTNSFIFNAATGNALEESISYSDDFLAPKVGRRDFYTPEDEDGRVDSNRGDATSSTRITWIDDWDRQYDSKEAYEDKAGKDPANPFLYTVDEETVLKTSTAKKTSDGYKISLDLDTVKGVARYVKRMLYLSDKNATYFYNVNLTFITDNDMRLKSLEVNEKYDIESALPTTGKLVTKFYYDNVPDVPDRTTPFDYSKYPK